MKLQIARHLPYVLIFMLVVTSILAFADNRSENRLGENTAKSMHDLYAETTQPITKRNLVIQSIDDNIIKRGMSFTDVKNLFDDRLIDLGREEKTNTRSAVVFFTPVIPPTRPLETAIQTGWYIDFRFSSDDKLEYYSLSNLHK